MRLHITALCIALAFTLDIAECKSGITVAFCPGDSIIYSDNSMARINYDRPQFIKAPGAKYPPMIRPNIRPGTMKPVPGVYNIVIQARDRLGNNAICTFQVSMRKPSCALPKVPHNGVLICDDEWQKTKNQTLCVIMCRQGYDVPVRDRYPPIAVCQSKRWTGLYPYSIGLQDCIKQGKGNLPEIFYFNGNLSEGSVQKDLKIRFIKFVGRFTPFCFMSESKKNCRPEKVKVYYP